MLYLVLPPIIIVVSLVLLVLFFSRRFPEVEKELSRQGGDPTAHASRPRIVEVGRNASLSALEYLMRRFKVVTLRAHNTLHQWMQSVHEKKARAAAPKPAEERLEAFREAPMHTDPHAIVRKPAEPVPPKERSVRPMISPRVTHPESFAKPVVAEPPVVKDQFEDILIERIAANPRDIEAYERLGEYYMEQGNVQDAKECYRQVLRLSPVHRLAKIKIRRLEKMLEQK